jgi:hypothetical protein
MRLVAHLFKMSASIFDLANWTPTGPSSGAFIRRDSFDSGASASHMPLNSGCAIKSKTSSSESDGQADHVKK